MTKKRKKICKLRKYTYLCIPKNDGAVAQMVEQWTENPCVGSSILPSTTKYTPYFANYQRFRAFFVTLFVNQSSTKPGINEIEAAPNAPGRPRTHIQFSLLNGTKVQNNSQKQ